MTGPRVTPLRQLADALRDPDPLLRTGEVARRLDVAPRTILTWAEKGKLASIRTPGGHLRIRASEVERVRQAMHNGGDS